MKNVQSVYDILTVRKIYGDAKTLVIRYLCLMA